MQLVRIAWQSVDSRSDSTVERSGQAHPLSRRRNHRRPGHGGSHAHCGDTRGSNQNISSELTIQQQTAPRAQDMASRRTRYKHVVDELERRKNRTKVRVRSKVEHVFGVMKR
jgi:IS5 family transposase